MEDELKEKINSWDDESKERLKGVIQSAYYETILQILIEAGITTEEKYVEKHSANLKKLFERFGFEIEEEESDEDIEDD